MTIGEGLTKIERETIATFHEGSDTVNVSTCSPVFARKLEAICKDWDIEPDRMSEWCLSADLPISALRFSKPRVLSDAQRAHLAHMRDLQRQGKELDEIRPAAD